MTTFIEDSSDYLGETVTAEYEPRHQQLDSNGKPVWKSWSPETYAYVGGHRWNVRRHRRAPWDGAR